MQKQVWIIGCAIVTSVVIGCGSVASAADGKANETAAAQDNAADSQASGGSENQKHQANRINWRPSREAKLVSHSRRDIEKYPLIVQRVDQAGGIRGNLASIRTLDGRMVTRIFRLAPESDPAAVVSAYRKRLEQHGYRSVFTCHGQTCGPYFLRLSPGVREADRYFGQGSDSVQYLVAEKPGSAFDRYAVLQTGISKSGKTYLMAGRIQTKPLEIAGIHITARKMAQNIAQTGRAILYGLYFAFDSAKLKPGSKATLKEIAKLLRQQPKLDLLVVGHTDNRGSFQYNLKLSKRRAHSVVDALVNDYGIDPGRLKPWGDGATSPRTSNRTELGRARNRRVELVPY